jgi:hypothetical protein
MGGNLTVTNKAESSMRITARAASLRENPNEMDRPTRP